MQLVGMLDSPYVRRVAVSLKFMGLPFDHAPVSVFRHYDRFAAINPVVKAPTLVTDEDVVLMESSLILAFLERLVDPMRSLMPTELGALARTQRIAGLALAACEKTVQLVYEHELRPQEKHHQPWIDRVAGQLREAFKALEGEFGDEAPEGLFSRPRQCAITTAVAWRFTEFARPEAIDTSDFPRLAALSRHAESLPEFTSTPLE